MSVDCMAFLQFFPLFSLLRYLQVMNHHHSPNCHRCSPFQLIKFHHPYFNLIIDCRKYSLVYHFYQHQQLWYHFYFNQLVVDHLDYHLCLGLDPFIVYLWGHRIFLHDDGWWHNHYPNQFQGRWVKQYLLCSFSVQVILYDCLCRKHCKSFWGKHHREEPSIRYLEFAVVFKFPICSIQPVAHSLLRHLLGMLWGLDRMTIHHLIFHIWFFNQN